MEIEVEKNRLDEIRKFRPTLTDQEIAEEALRQYRICLEKEGQRILRHTHSLSIREDIWEMLKARAKRKKMSISRYIEDLCQKYMRAE